jgi:glycerol-3-phosphate dehydrogenase
MAYEFARTADDVVWRRSKLGLRLSAQEIAALDRWMADCFADGSAPRQNAASH